MERRWGVQMVMENSKLFSRIRHDPAKPFSFHSVLPLLDSGKRLTKRIIALLLKWTRVAL